MSDISFPRFKTYYLFSPEGFFESAVSAGIDPLESKKQGVAIYIQPDHSTDIEPPSKVGAWPKFVNGKWTSVKLPKTIDELAAFGKIKHDHTVAFWRELNKLRTDLMSNAERYTQDLKDGYWEVKKLPDPTPEEIAAQELAKAKSERSAAVSKIVVEVTRKAKNEGEEDVILLFDGDEEAQTRMGRTIAAAVAQGVDIENTYRTWVLADNSIAQVSIAELAKALQLAGDAQTELWTVPYQEK